jgi:ribosomal-protein-alanine N-acetyltransferase
MSNTALHHQRRKVQHYRPMSAQFIEITDMTRDDLDEILQIEKASFHEPWSRGMFLHELQSTISRCIVARTCGNAFPEIAGYMIYWLFSGEAHIHKMAVQEVLRQQGVATKLLGEMIRLSLQEGAQWCVLEVARSNERAKKFYEKFGFRVQAVRERYYAESGDDAFIMAVDIKECIKWFHERNDTVDDGWESHS